MSSMRRRPASSLDTSNVFLIVSFSWSCMSARGPGSPFSPAYLRMSDQIIIYSNLVSNLISDTNLTSARAKTDHNLKWAHASPKFGNKAKMAVEKVIMTCGLKQEMHHFFFFFKVVFYNRSIRNVHDERIDVLVLEA